jgi:hypothetical protein
MAFQPTPLWNPVEVAPPWGWNPAATFLTAYTEMQKNQQAKQEFELGMEMERYLLPIKKQTAQLSLEKMQLEMERTKGEIERQRVLTRQMTDATRNVNRGFNSGLAEGPANNQQPNKADDPLSFNISTASNSSNVLGGGVKPVSGR